MSKILPGHNGMESDSVNGAVNFTTGLKINGTEVLPEADVVALVEAQAIPSDVTTTAAGVSASGDLDGADTVDEAATEAAILALETEVGLLKDDVEALATAFNSLIDSLTTAGVFTA